MQTITISDASFAALNEAAQRHGVTLSALLDEIAQDMRNEHSGPYTGEEFLRLLGADDDEINAPIEEDDDEPGA